MSEERKVDLRVQKTERALVRAMIELLGEKTFDEITVSDLCNTATIRRATFYKHFRDKHDFLDFCVQEKQRQFDASYAQLKQSDPLDYYMRIIADMIRYMKENRPLLERSAQHAQHAGMANLFTKQLAHTIAEQAVHMECTDTYPQVPSEVVAAFFTGAMHGVVRWWFTTDSSITEDALLQYIRTLMASCMPSCDTQNEEGNNERESTKE